MEIQKGLSSPVFTKSMVAVVIAAIVGGLDRGLLVLPIFKLDIEKCIMQNSKPLENLWMLIITILIFYFGVQILSALRGSKRFRDECLSKTQPKENHNFLMIIIVVMMCFQLITLALHILQSTLDALMYNKFKNCIEYMKSPIQLIKCQEIKVETYLKNWSFLRLTWCHFLEQLFIMLLVIYKKVSSNNDIINNNN